MSNVIPTGRVKVNESLCKGCGLCVSACPRGVLILSESGEVNEFGNRTSRVVNPDACDGCGLCARICPDSALAVWRIMKRRVRQRQ